MVILLVRRLKDNPKRLTPTNGISLNFIHASKVLPDSNNVIYYYPSGSIENEGWMLWEEDPQLDIIQDYGDWKYYGEAGKITNVNINYDKRGKPIKIATSYDAEGRPVEVKTYYDDAGERVEVEKRYDKTGKRTTVKRNYEFYNRLAKETIIE